MKDRLNDFGQRLKKLRNGSGLSQAQFAERAGISVEHLSKLERGAGGPSFTVLWRLADALRLNPGEFFVESSSSGQGYKGSLPVETHVDELPSIRVEYASAEMEWSPTFLALVGDGGRPEKPSFQVLEQRYVHPDDRKRAAMLHNDVMRSKDVDLAHLRLKTGNGNVSHCLVDWIIKRYGDGEPFEAVGRFLDLTDLLRKGGLG